MSKLPVPPGVREGIALVKEAIGLEQRKDYWAARTKYVEAAVKIVEGSAAYPDGSSERRAARQKAAQYADRSEALTRLIERKGLTRSPPRHPPPPPPTRPSQPQQLQSQQNDMYASNMYAGAPDPLRPPAAANSPTIVSSSSPRISVNNSANDYVMMDDAG